MAEAPGHLLGQIIGNVLEASVEPLLAAVAERHGLYLDCAGERPARPGKKVTWEDSLGNTHDLDFVLERGGTDHVIGRPAAFIECAWRRYTKHSRAKAQEIQGALLPLLARYGEYKPFAGAVVAGNWTKGALEQLRTSGFAVLHLDYADIVDAFAEFGVDVAADETTSDEYLQQQVDSYNSLSTKERAELAASLCDDSSDDYAKFAAALDSTLSRRILRILVVPLHGRALEYASIEDATIAVATYNYGVEDPGPFVRFEIQLTYSNGDSITAKFEDATEAVRFLESFK